jgi:hypothetical protein
MSIISSRKNTLYKDQNYVIPSKGLITGWRITSEYPSSLFPVLTLGSYKLNIPRKDKNYISIKEIRDYIRNIDLPETEDEQKMINIDNLFFGFQLAAITFYPSLTTEEFNDSVFTRDIKEMSVQFINTSEDGEEELPEAITIEEDYWDRTDEKQSSLVL